MPFLRVLFGTLRRLFGRSVPPSDSSQTVLELPRPRRARLTAEEFAERIRKRALEGGRKRKRDRGTGDQRTMKE